MNPATWTDLFSTVRYVFGILPPLVAAVGAIFAGYYAFRAKTLGEQNSGHLLKQDKTIAVIADVAVIAAKSNPDDGLRARVESLASDIERIRKDPGPGA